MKQLILAFLGSIFPSIIFNIDRKNIHWAGLAGTLGWGMYVLTLRFTSGTVFAVFLGAVIVGIYAEIMARVRKTPASVFAFAGIFPLVPGIGAYNTVRAIVERRVLDSYSMGLETIASAGAIAFGIMLASAIFRFFSTWKMKRLQGIK